MIQKGWRPVEIEYCQFDGVRIGDIRRMVKAANRCGETRWCLYQYRGSGLPYLIGDNGGSRLELSPRQGDFLVRRFNDIAIIDETAFDLFIMRTNPLERQNDHQ